MQSSVFPRTHQLNDDEARELVQGLAERLVDNCTVLHNALSSNADAVANRSRKRSREKRRALLASISTLHPEQYTTRFLPGNS
jgi:hypothetical protein